MNGINDPSNEAETANNSVKGTNNSNKSGNVMGVNNHPENSETNGSDVIGTNDQKTNVIVPTLINTTSNQENASLPTSGDKPADSHHKRCPKPKGSHTRPTCPQSPASASVSLKKELNSEFITVTHGLKNLRSDTVSNVTSARVSSTAKDWQTDTIDLPTHQCYARSASTTPTCFASTSTNTYQ